MLYVVPTPIGNLEDITVRGLRILGESTTILCEDPRVTKKLLNLLNIDSKPVMVALTRNQDINYTGIIRVLNSIKEGDTISLVTDAGTPGMSDPGAEVVRMAQEAEITYTILPGATALVPAAVASGFVSKEFVFLGFLPIKKGRQMAWGRIAIADHPMVIYESVHRITKFLNEAQQKLEPDRKICICREITKSFESIWVGTVKDLDSYILKEKGEFVVVIDKVL